MKPGNLRDWHNVVHQQSRVDFDLYRSTVCEQARDSEHRYPHVTLKPTDAVVTCFECIRYEEPA